MSRLRSLTRRLTTVAATIAVTTSLLIAVPIAVPAAVPAASAAVDGSPGLGTGVRVGSGAGSCANNRCGSPTPGSTSGRGQLGNVGGGPTRSPQVDAALTCVQRAEQGLGDLRDCPAVRMTQTLIWRDGQQTAPTGLQAAFTGCAPNQWGPRVGATFTWRQHVQVSGRSIIPGSVSWTCLDGPRWRDSTIRCAVEIGPGAVTGPHNSQYNPAQTLDSVPRQATRFASTRSPAACAGSYEVAVAATASLPGQYVASAEGRQVTCTLRTYTTTDLRTGRVPAPEVIGCSAPYRVRAEVKLTVWCGGWEPGWTRRDFSPTACLDQGPAENRWSCAPANPLVDGMPPRDVFKGQVREATWGPLQVTGAVRNVRNIRTRFAVDPQSTPWHAGADYATGQPWEVRLTPTGSSLRKGAWQPGDVRSAWILLHDASIPDQPWTLHRTVRFDAEYLVKSVRISRIDLQRKTIATETVDTWTPLTGACESTLQVEGFRARNSN